MKTTAVSPVSALAPSILLFILSIIETLMALLISQLWLLGDSLKRPASSNLCSHYVTYIYR